MRTTISILSRLLVLASLLILTSTTASAVNYTSRATGNWSTTTTWTPNGNPGAADNVTITSGFTVTLTAAAACASLTINSGATLATGNFQLTFNGNFVNNGGTFTCGSSAIVITNTATTQSIDDFTTTGAITVSKTAGTATLTGNVNAASLAFTGADNTTLALGSGVTLTLTGGLSMPRPGSAAITLAVGTGTLSCGSITLSGTTGTTRTTVLTISTGTVTVSGNITSAGVASQIIFSGAGTLYAGGTFMSGTAGTFTASTGTVNFNAAGAQSIAPFAYTFNNVTLSRSGAKTTTNATINGILSMEGTATTTGTVPTYGAAATLQYNTATSRNAGAEWITPFAATGGVIIANTGTITLTAAKVFNVSVPLTIDSGATLATGNFQLTFGGNFVNNGGTFTCGSSAIVITNTATTQSIDGFTTTGAITVSKTAGTATLTGNVNAASLAFTGADNTTLALGSGVTLTLTGGLSMPRPGSAAITLAVGTGTLSCGSITLSGTTGTTRTTVLTISTGTVTVSGNITSAGVASQIIFSGAGTLYAGGTFMSGTAGTFTASTGTVNFNAAGAQSIAPFAYTFNNVTLSRSGAKTTTNATINGILSMEGTATTTGTVPTYGAAATLQYNTATSRNAGAEWITPFAATGGVIIANTGTITLNAAKVLNASVPLTIDSGATLNASNYNIDIGGSWTNSGTFTAGTSTTTFTGAAQTIGGTSSTTFGPIIIASGATYTMNNSNSCTGLTFAASAASSSLTHGSTSTLTVNGPVTINPPSADNYTTAWNINAGSATVGGDVTLTAGTADSRVTQINITTGTLDVNGSITLANTTSDIRTAINITGAGNIYITGNLGSTGTFGTLVPGTSSTITFDGTGAQTIALVGAMFFNNVIVNKQSGTATFSILEGPYFEAEDATMSGPVFANDHPGYSGTGFADYQNLYNDYVEWTVNVGTALSTELVFRYALDSTDRPLELRINGVVVDDSMPFSRTSHTSWSDYSIVQSVSVNLRAGTDSIRLTAIGQSGANIDYLAIGSINSVVLGNFSVLSGTAQIANSFMVDGNLTVHGTLNLSRFTMNGNSSGKVLTLGSTGILQVGGTSGGVTGSNFPTGYTGTPSISPTSRVLYNGTAVQTIANTVTYGILEVNNTAGVNLNNGTVTVSTLTLTAGNMTTGLNLVRVTTSRGGNGLIIGTIRQIHPFAVGTTYYYEGPNTFIIYTAMGTTPDSVTVTSYPNKGIPVGDSTKAIKRYYNIVTSGGSGDTATLQLHYDSTSERNNLNAATFSLWRWNGSAWEDQGGIRGGAGTADWVQQTGLTNLTLTNNYWTIAVGAGPLPVQLTSFTVSAKKFDITLEWNTASEKNNYGFDIERQSTDGIWTKIGFVGGHGTTTIPQEYSYTDKNTSPGKLSYRLKQIDFDGKFEYSKAVDIVSGATSKSFMLGQNYPCPFNPITTIEFSIPDDAPTLLKVYNVLGQEVASLVDGEVLSSGLIHKITFDGSNLSSGTYYYVLKSGKFSAVKKMILLK